ncbi:LysR family transcriptional regulator [Variovorax sp. CAN2819]|uniref:LysR family transcriptional regulator n=1 Tax=Variovorax sp. CAN15 TaxID=3046727 RepID=UPI00264A3244|nr:LysR family transcriptional regulator [Variovorax sp. CAN15]MDN6882442.1 LysR family transcriptional regulator [Variovorax sp. CAN15]
MTRPISVRQLQCFLAVAQERSFRRAAERLAITQPPLSRQIAELETALGVRLFDRDTHSVRLTPVGEVALHRFSSLMDEFDAAVAHVAHASHQLPRLRLGVLNWVQLRGLASLENTLMAGGHASGVDARTTTTAAAMSALRKNELDAAIVLWPASMQRLRGDLVHEVPLMAFVPATSALARKRSIAVRELEALPPFYRFTRAENARMYDEFTRQYAAHGFTPVEAAGAPDALHVFAQIGAGRGCTCLPAPFSLHRYAGVQPRPLRERIMVPVVLVTHLRLPQELHDILVAATADMLKTAPEKAGRSSK